MTEPTLRLMTGWRDAVRELGLSPVRWWITPALSDEAFAAEVRPGDRVLVRGTADDVERGSTDLELLRWLHHAGVEVRRDPRLHLRAYVAVHPASDGVARRARAWIGSADATRRGRGERSGGTREAMAGPFDLDEARLTLLDRLWNDAETIDPTVLEDEVRQLRRDAERIALSHARESRWMVRLEVEAGSRRWTPPHVRRGTDPDAATSEEDSVPYLPSRHPLRRDVVAFSRALRTRLRAEGLLAALPGELGTNTYLVAADRAEELRRILSLADRKLRDRFRRRVEGERSELSQDFAARVDAWLTLHADPDSSDQANPLRASARATALRSFETFLDGSPVAVRYALSIPVESNDAAFDGASEMLQPALLPTVEGDPERLVDDALARAGSLAAD